MDWYNPDIHVPLSTLTEGTGWALAEVLHPHAANRMQEPSLSLFRELEGPIKLRVTWTGDSGRCSSFAEHGNAANPKTMSEHCVFRCSILLEDTARVVVPEVTQDSSEGRQAAWPEPLG